MDAVALTFLFTDIEGSTRLWETEPDAMRSALARHDDIVRAAIVAHGGRVFKTIGDAFCAVFEDADQALAATAAFQRELSKETWPTARPILVRAALHTGPAEHRADDYFGQTLNRVARLLAIGHGGQALISGATHAALTSDGMEVVDMGSHRLKDLSEAERVYQLAGDGLETNFPPLRSLSFVPNNLPQQASAFVGREEEIASIRDALAATRLLTLTGSGGCGKTRLALQVAAEVLTDFPDGIWLEELATVNDPELVAQSLANTLGLRVTAGASPVERVQEYLAERYALVIFDNCEHLIESCAELAAQLLRHCPNLRIIVTSREALRIGGEKTWRVPSLSTPEPGPHTAEGVLEFEAARLFADRARLQQPNFVVTDGNAPILADICARLDGIPLAIELAAARCRVLSLEQISERLTDQFRLLAGGDRAALPRQQTLRAAIDWSYDLLSEEERAVLRRLSVFRGGWTLEASESVCEGEGVDAFDILDILSRLIDKSLANVEEVETGSRYAILGSIRLYAEEKLREAQEERPTALHHREFYAALADSAKPELEGTQVALWLRRLEYENGNLRAALQNALDDPESGDTALKMGCDIARYWHLRGHFWEALRWLTAALERTPAAPAPLRAGAHYAIGICNIEQADFAAASEHFQNALGLWKEIGDRSGEANVYNVLGILASQQGEYENAMQMYEKSLAINREEGKKANEMRVLNNLGILAKRTGDNAKAKALYEEALAASRSLGNRDAEALYLNNLGNIAIAEDRLLEARDTFETALQISREVGKRPGEALNLGNLGDVNLKLGETQSAIRYHTESLTIRKELGDKLGIAYNLEGIASVLATGPDKEVAARIFSAAEALRESIGSLHSPEERQEAESALSALRAALGDALYDAAWHAGKTMKVDDAVDLALNGAGR